MRQGFRRFFFRLSLDPRTPIYGVTLFLYGYGLLTGRLIPIFLALVLVLAAERWVKVGGREVGDNFRILPSLVGPRLICQSRQKNRRSCGELRRSLILDSKLLPRDLPAGTYHTITHDAVIRRLRRVEGLTVWKQQYAYSGDLRKILSGETGGRCKHCPAKCRAWSVPPQAFYKVTFSYDPSDSE